MFKLDDIVSIARRGSKRKLRCSKGGVAMGYVGERGLLMAILDRALRDLRVLDAKDDCPGSYIDYECAWNWVFSYRKEEFDYEWVLEHLNLDSEVIRDVVLGKYDICGTYEENRRREQEVRGVSAALSRGNQKVR